MSSDAIDDAMRLHRQGRLADAAAMYERLLSSDAANHDIHRRLGVARLQLGDLRGAEQALLRARRLAPHSVQVHSDLGALLLAQGRFRDAVGMLEEVLRHSPDHPDALNHCAIAWTEMEQPERAAPLFERLARVRPNSSAAFRLLGDTQYKQGRNDDAIASLQRALELDPDDRQARLLLGEVHESLGSMREARGQYVALLRRNPGSPLALARLLMLSGGEAEASWLEQARAAAEAEDTPAEARARISIAIAHHYDRLGSYDEAFRWIERGNSLLRQQRPYDVARFGEAVDRLIEVFTRPQIDELRSRFACPSEKPLFIVGMPRSGTTLVEQMLASHPAVGAGGELSTMLNVAARVRTLAGTTEDYPYAVRALGASQLSELAGFYLGRLQAIAPAVERVTDKLPFNFMHVGLIAALFPRAAIVHCWRDALDTCVSCYFTSFSEQIRFASDQGTLGRYYRHYQRLMCHWHDVVPERIIDVEYEQMVARTESRLRELLAHCGLAWEQRCLEFHDTPRSIRTPSRWQVRRPISSASVGRSQRYASWLGPLREALAATD